jgi:hypothetical protein
MRVPETRDEDSNEHDYEANIAPAEAFANSLDDLLGELHDRRHVMKRTREELRALSKVLMDHPSARMEGPSGVLRRATAERLDALADDLAANGPVPLAAGLASRVYRTTPADATTR